MTLKNYIWTSEELKTYAFQILETVWPVSHNLFYVVQFDKVRLLGVKLSNLKNQAEVKKDKHLTDFFKSNMSKEDY